MKNKSIALLFTIFFLFFNGSSVVFAESYVAEGSGNSSPIYTNENGIKAITIKDNTDIYREIWVKVGSSWIGSGNFWESKVVLTDISRLNSYSCGSMKEVYLKLPIRSEEDPELTPPSERIVSITEVELCDGTIINFDDPFPPPIDPDPDPPIDEGGSLPPSKDWGKVDTSKPANACGQPRWTSPVRNWVDDIFCPVITFLDLAKAKLAAVSLMMGQGLNIGQYFRIFGDLPTSWQLVVSSLLLMVATLGGLLIFRSAMRIYYSIKEGVKWW